MSEADHRKADPPAPSGYRYPGNRTRARHFLMAKTASGYNRGNRNCSRAYAAALSVVICLLRAMLMRGCNF